MAGISSDVVYALAVLKPSKRTFMMFEAFLSRGGGWISFILVAFLFCFGLYATIYPHRIALQGKHWRLKGNWQPGNTALFLIRLGGIIMILIAVTLAFIYLLAAFSHYWEYGSI